MELTNDIFSENVENNSSEKIIGKIHKGEWKDVLHGLCFIKENEVIINYVYFKHLATQETYSCILNYITNNFDIVLSKNIEFIIHVNMKNLTLSDIDKHKSFIYTISEYLKERYPKKLSKCYVYNAPCFFSKVFTIVSMFIDKDTMKKIELVVTK